MRRQIVLQGLGVQTANESVRSMADSIFQSLRNVTRNATRRGYLTEMVRKVVLRVRGEARGRDKDEIGRRLDELAVPLEDVLRPRDEALWAESLEFAAWLDDHASAHLAALGVDLGGGGDYRLLYFLTRSLRPERVIETGVAAGFSSVAILKALDSNGAGHLYSSDFPYFRLENPEQYIGTLVPETLRERWTLDIRGDRKALPDFVSAAAPVDLVHYDSDKSSKGREFAMRLLVASLAPAAVVVMDDIDDDDFFLRWSSHPDFVAHVFEFQGKHVGMIELASGTGAWPSLHPGG